MIKPMPSSVKTCVLEIFKRETEEFASKRWGQDALWNERAPGLLDALEELREISKGAFDFRVGLANYDSIGTNLPRKTGPFLEHPSLQEGLVLSLERNDQQTFDVKMMLGEEKKKDKFDRLTTLISFLSERIISAEYLTHSPRSIPKARTADMPHP